MRANSPAGRFRLPPRHFVVPILAPAVLTFAFLFGVIFPVIIPTMKTRILERKQEMIRALSETAWSQLAGVQEQEERGMMTRAAAQAAALARIQDLRYGATVEDCFWVCDLRPRMIVHPSRPELNGQDLSVYTDLAGKRIFMEFAQLAQEKGAGYVEYLEPRPNDPTRAVRRLAYVKGFIPWGWVVGTSFDLEEVQAEISHMTRHVLAITLGLAVVLAGFLVYLARHSFHLERQRWKAETALRDSEEKYRQLVEGTSEGVMLVLEDRPVYANKTLLNRLGFSEAEVGQFPLDKLLTLAPGPGLGEPAAERRGHLIPKSGDAAEVLVAASPVAVGDKSGQILSIRPLAPRKKTEETLARLVADLQSLLPLATRSIKACTLTLVTCGLRTPIREAAAAMVQAQLSAILIRDDDGAPVGIVTDQDLRSRVLAEGRDPGEPVSAIMSAPIFRIAEQALLFEAARVMQQHNVRHLLVTNPRGAAVGILTSKEILQVQQHAITLLLADIDRATSPEALRDSRARLPVFIKALLDCGARVEYVTRIMTTVADAILRRLIALALADLGPAPAPFSFVVLGSEGRQEQTLATDQDNAIIYANVPPERNEEVQAYFLRLATTVCRGLDLAGYRLCRGEVMASNPKWCQPLSCWRQYFSDCVTSDTLRDLLDVNVFFDFRCAYGDTGHVTQLREHLHRLLEGENRHAFFFHLAQGTLEYRPPRGFFGNIQFEAAAGHAAAFNVKAAILPLVNFARLYALQHHFPETNTLERLQRLRDQNLLIPSSHEELVQAYTTLMQMRLTHQATRISQGLEPDNLIGLDELTQIERSVLKKVFADITVFQARLRTDFARTA